MSHQVRASRPDGSVRVGRAAPRLVLILGLLGLAVLVPSGVAQAGGLKTFRTQSGNVQCAYIDLGEMLGGKSVRCDVIRRRNDPPSRPSSCEQDYGIAYEIRERGRGKILCAGDTVADRDGRKLAVKRTYRFGQFRCRATRTTMRCYRGSSGAHGILLGLRRQSVY